MDHKSTKNTRLAINFNPWKDLLRLRVISEPQWKAICYLLTPLAQGLGISTCLLAEGEEAFPRNWTWTFLLFGKGAALRNTDWTTGSSNSISEGFISRGKRYWNSSRRTWHFTIQGYKTWEAPTWHKEIFFHSEERQASERAVQSSW